MRGTGRPSSGRTAFFLYVLLVVLPAAVFGGLLWRQLGQYQDRLLTELPIETRDAAERLGRACHNRVLRILDEEHARLFEEYAESYFHNEFGELERETSPLASGPRRESVLGYFSFRTNDLDFLDGDEQNVTVLRGVGSGGPDPVADEIERIVRQELLLPKQEDRPTAAQLMEWISLEGYGDVRRRPLGPVILNVARGAADECLRAVRARDDLFGVRKHQVFVEYFVPQKVDLDPARLPLVLAVRNVVTEGIFDPTLPTCIDAISSPVTFCQGFVLDPEWLYRKMPQEEADRVLGPSLSLRTADQVLAPGAATTVESVNLLRRLGLDSARATPEEWSPLRVTADASELREDFAVQNRWFAGMAIVLSISMLIGIRLMLASIRSGRQEAERTRNFVASVTHELRTPIAAVKLYGEMLEAGWVADPEKRDEYLKRIVSESDRLDGLVDRVLLRRKLFERDHSPTAGDLNSEVEAQREDLEIVGGRRADDLEFEFEPDLPAVLLLPEGVHVILQNLVENARKYAPVEKGERILIRTRKSQKGRVLLEVLDRGPGIPEQDRTRVFEAFLRLGDEHTRRTKGTGLGLHLVQLQARAMKARVRALPRTGGGTVFQVLFARA